MDPAMAKQAAALIWAAWREKRPLEALPEQCRPRTIDDGYAIQDALVELVGDPVVGWKIGATSRQAQAMLNVDGPFCGRVFGSNLLQSPAMLGSGAVRLNLVEAEFAFRLSRDLPPRARAYSIAELDDAVEAVYPAIELPDARFVEWSTMGVAHLIADDACAGYLILGRAEPAWRGLDLAGHAVSASVDGQVVGTGSGAEVLGDPRIALTWLANERARRGDGLARGQVVTTGSCLQPFTVTPGQSVTADFGRLGTVELSFGT